jgi:hypothetical protein
MTTYAETKGRKPFDWNAYIDDAIKTKKKLDSCSSERCRMINLSGRWDTDVLANIPVEIERDEFGAPLDNKLRELGEGFTNAIISQNWKSAKNILDIIYEKINQPSHKGE